MPWDNEGAIALAIDEVLARLRQQGYEQAGASHGTALVREAPTRHQLMNLADKRMYARKHEGRRARAAGPAEGAPQTS